MITKPSELENRLNWLHTALLFWLLGDDMALNRMVAAMRMYPESFPINRMRVVNPDPNNDGNRSDTKIAGAVGLLQASRRKDAR